MQRVVRWREHFPLAMILRLEALPPRKCKAPDKLRQSKHAKHSVAEPVLLHSHANQDNTQGK